MICICFESHALCRVSKNVFSGSTNYFKCFIFPFPSSARSQVQCKKKKKNLRVWPDQIACWVSIACSLQPALLPSQWKAEDKFLHIVEYGACSRYWSRAHWNGHVLFCLSLGESGRQPIWSTSLKTHHCVLKGDYMETVWISRVSCLIWDHWRGLSRILCFSLCSLCALSWHSKPWGEKDLIWREKRYLYWGIFIFS